MRYNRLLWAYEFDEISLALASKLDHDFSGLIAF